ncbi:DUF1223 domain-containing protein [Rhodovulum sp. DZ06]|uniref:DUF1223 domain-containing protein n=1 Tax=Rhodovulum sp. DZ06 TaxID=3425126 RepID=UPI003D345CB4
MILPALLRRCRAALLSLPLLAGAGGGALAGEPVVIELYTSQGCASCPPADAYLSELADAPGVIALSLHVDYWDYLGWRDTHARHAFTERQIAYRDMIGARSVYTPQMVIDGQARVVGSRRSEVRAALSAAAAQVDPIAVTLTRDADGLWAELVPQGPFTGEAVVWLVGYETRPEPVRIKRGENAGRVSAHRNVVGSWMKIGRVSAGAGAQRIMAPAPEGADGIAVIVQQGRVGPVLGAAKLED